MTNESGTHKPTGYYGLSFPTVTAQKEDPFRPHSYDPDFEGCEALNIRYSNRWKGYNGYWKTMLSLKVTQNKNKFQVSTERFVVAYHNTNGEYNLTDIRKRGMYGY
jgi:hypothetical protein